MRFVPGPKETETEYTKRVEYCLHLKSEFPEIAFSEERAALATGLQKTKQLYDISPDWVPLFYSNQGLALWHAGAAWIFQKEKGSPLGALLQLRKNFSAQASYLFYHRDEIIAHELCHIGRMAFEEKKYEELLAYRTSDRLFPRYFGPVLQSAGESRLFMIVLLTILIMDVAFLFFGSLDIYFHMFYLKLIPLFLLLWAIFRLWKRQEILKKAEKKLKEVWDEPWFILYRLTDQEIEQFAKSTAEDIKSYAEQDNSFRWSTIKTAYGKKDRFSHRSQ